MPYVAAVSVSDIQSDAQIRSGSQDHYSWSPRLAILLLHSSTVCKTLSLIRACIYICT